MVFLCATHRIFRFRRYADEGVGLCKGGRWQKEGGSTLQNILRFKLPIVFIIAVLSLGLTSIASAQFAYQTCYDGYGNAYQIPFPETCAQAGLSSTPTSVYTSYQTCYDAYGNPYQVLVGQGCSGYTTAAQLGVSCNGVYFPSAYACSGPVPSGMTGNTVCLFVPTACGNPGTGAGPG